MAAFAKLVAAGKVATLGASNFHAARLKSANDSRARRNGQPHFEALQPEYNLVSRHKFEGELQDYCVEPQYRRAALLRPRLGLPDRQIPQRPPISGRACAAAGCRRISTAKGAAVLAAMDAVAAETGASLAQIALAWLAAQPGVTAPIASATSIEQLDELAGSRDLALTSEQLDRLTAAGA